MDNFKIAQTEILINDIVLMHVPMHIPQSTWVDVLYDGET